MLRNYIFLKLKIDIQVSNKGILPPSVQIFSCIGFWEQTSVHHHGASSSLNTEAKMIISGVADLVSLTVHSLSQSLDCSL